LGVWLFTGAYLDYSAFATGRKQGRPRSPDGPGFSSVPERDAGMRITTARLALARAATDSRGRPHLRYDDMIPVPGMAGDPAVRALCAGQSVGLLHEEASAGQIVTEIARQAQQALAALAGED
jgi:hypothetical protein